MPVTEQNIPIILKKIEGLLEAGREQNIFLKIVDHKQDEDWLYVVVVPSAEGVRASDYATYMSQVERSLRNDGDDNVFLVPALDD